MAMITALMASALTVLYFMAALKIVKLRHQHKVSIGDGGIEELQQAIRAHGNLTEYVPLALVLVLCLELNGVAWWLTAIPAVVFVVARVMHWRGFSRNHMDLKSRVLSMKLTIFSLLGLAGMNVLAVLWRLF